MTKYEIQVEQEAIREEQQRLSVRMARLNKFLKQLEEQEEEE